MARLLTVINERKKVCEEYRRKLEEEYIEKQRKVYEEKLALEAKKKEHEPYVPEITRQLVQAKFRDLKRGVDNTDYIKEAVQIKRSKSEEMKKLQEKYDYKKKKIVKLDEKVDEKEKDSVQFIYNPAFMHRMSNKIICAVEDDWI